MTRVQQNEPRVVPELYRVFRYLSSGRTSIDPLCRTSIDPLCRVLPRISRNTVPQVIRSAAFCRVLYRSSCLKWSALARFVLYGTRDCAGRDPLCGALSCISQARASGDPLCRVFLYCVALRASHDPLCGVLFRSFHHVCSARARPAPYFTAHCTRSDPFRRFVS